MDFLTPAYIISILIALSIHEWAHAYSAYKLGDPTSKDEGRLTINPIAHLDPLGTLMFIIVGFGWGKPVPVDPRYFKHERRDTAIVAAAGPFSNLCVAVIVLLIANGLDYFNLLSTETSVANFVEELLQTSVFLNLALMAFNLLPIAPLDGSKILRMFIPAGHQEAYEQFMLRGPFVLLGILILEPLLKIQVLSVWVYFIVKPILSVFDVISKFLQSL